MESAGLLVFRGAPAGLEVFLVHPGGPFYSGKDRGVWSLPKGLREPGEEPLEAARREFAEETSLPVPEGPYHDLGSIRMKSGKVVHAFACRGLPDPASLRSNVFEIEWPPRSGRRSTFPEVDRAAWFPAGEARRRIHPAQLPFLERLEQALEREGAGS